MLIHLLSGEEQNVFFDIAEILSISDKPLLWNGKQKEITLNTKLEDLSILRGEKETALLKQWRSQSDVKFHHPFMVRNSYRKEQDLLEILKNCPLEKIESPETRAKAASSVLRSILKEKSTKKPTSQKIILFQLILLALADGNITGVEFQFINEYKIHYQLDDYIFNDLLERAETTNRETQKTIALILE